LKDSQIGAEKQEAIEVDDEDDLDEEMGDGGVYVDDEDDEEGAVWCIKEGKMVDWGCFFALLYVALFLNLRSSASFLVFRTYVHETINPTFQTPNLLVHPPAFSLHNKQLVTLFMFERLKTPGFALFDSALAAVWGYGLSIIDVGFEKTDITPISDLIIQERARKTVSGCGGDTMTKHICRLLPDMKPARR
jgi:actin-related protein 9